MIWTDKELTLLKDQYSQIGPLVISKLLNRSKAAIQTKANLLNIKYNFSWTDTEDSYLRDNYKNFTSYELAKTLDLTRAQVACRLVFLGLRKIRKKELTVELVKPLLIEGLSLEKIAKKLCTNKNQIQRFCAISIPNYKTFLKPQFIDLGIQNQSAVNTHFGNYRNRAKLKNLEFTLTFLDFAELVQKNCVYCGSPPSAVLYSNSSKYTSAIVNGVDRVDNDLGYTLKNSVSCCGVCNRMKSVMTVDEFKAHIQKIVSVFKEGTSQ